MSAPRFRPWLQIARISNAPTIISNALTGCALGASAGVFSWRDFAIAAPALLLAYIGGMIMNDAVDAGVDARERPTRPIPSGSIRRRTAATIAATLLTGSLTLFWLAGFPALLAGAALVACIVLYNVLHKALASSVVLMGGCRALGLISAAATTGWPLRWEWIGPAAALLGVYVVSLSMAARREAGNPRRIRVVIAMLCAISLLDALLLSLASFYPQAGIAILCFFLALLGQRRILGT